jgi:hypothetical protein
MKITAIETRTFEQMKKRFEDFARQVKEFCSNGQAKEKWLNNQDVCELLQISLRTLQSYRDNGTIPYSQIGHKCYYKTSDMEQIINQSQIKRQQQ